MPVANDTGYSNTVVYRYPSQDAHGTQLISKDSFVVQAGTCYSSCFWSTALPSSLLLPLLPLLLILFSSASLRLPPSVHINFPRGHLSMGGGLAEGNSINPFRDSMVMTWGWFMTLDLPHSSNGCVYWAVTCWNLPGNDRDSVESQGNTKLGQHIVGSTSFCRCICFPSPKHLDLWWFMWTFTGYHEDIMRILYISQHMEAMGIPLNHPFQKDFPP